MITNFPAYTYRMAARSHKIKQHDKSLNSERLDRTVGVNCNIFLFLLSCHLLVYFNGPLFIVILYRLLS